jgi:hypothetical protein
VWSLPNKSATDASMLAMLLANSRSILLQADSSMLAFSERWAAFPAISAQRSGVTLSA